MSGKFLFALLAAAALLRLADAHSADTPDTRRAEADRQLEQGNYKNAAELYRALALSLSTPPKDAAGDLRKAFAALSNLDLPAESEKLLDDAAELWRDGWRVPAAAAELRRALPGTVNLQGGQYVRTASWPRRYLNAAQRDRVIALRLMLQAETRLDSPSDPASPADKRLFYKTFADIVAHLRIDWAPWRFTALTDLDTLPDYDDYNGYYSDRDRAAPVDAEGNPVYYPMPESWEAAKNDGQRWRWLLGRMADPAVAGDETGAESADLMFANFLLTQFGVQTMGPGVAPARYGETESDTGAFAVRTLAENETLAKLANGIKRFTLPPEYDFIAIYRRLASKAKGPTGYKAGEILAHIFENRQQYDKAVLAWEDLLRRHPDSNTDANRGRLNRITGKNGLLKAGPVAPAGTKTTIPYLFRNGSRVELTARRLDEKRLLRDIRHAYKSGVGAFRTNYALQSPEQLGRMVVERGLTEYVIEETARWAVDLDPRPGHYSSRAFIELPFAEAGCYLVEAAMDGGNTSRVVLWLADLALVRKAMGDRQLLYVADAVSGNPVPGATLSLFGYELEHDEKGGQPKIITREFAEKSGDDGLAVVETKGLVDKHWIIAAETDDGRFAYLGFEPVWAERTYNAAPAGRSAFVITDRPVYRPDQAVNFKVWLGETSYAQQLTQYLSGHPIPIIIRNPMGETVYEKTLTTDAHGGVADAVTLGADQPLGGYTIEAADNYAGFRLEEYRKPEFEVAVETPDSALALGDTTQIKVKASYYFGSPVANATVHYKVLRTPHRTTWYPPWRWDWLYGPGSSWIGYDYAWYPGWGDWGTARPLPAWIGPRYPGQPELVAEGDGALDDDGLFRFNLDTMPAKELFGDSDHKYAITVEVADASRRVIVGSGEVVAARKPYSVTVWTDRGFYLAGQDITASVKATLPLGGGVRATGTATLRRIRYDSGKPVETEVASWPVATDDRGDASLRLSADAPGQYRLSCVMKDATNTAIEGAALLTVRGGEGSGDFRFTGLELVPDRREYEPGDVLRLAVNSERPDATVLLLPRAERNASGAMPAVVRLENGTQILDIAVADGDRPNFFVEALTIFDGRVYSETREIFVPPADKTLTVEVESDKPRYAPGEKASFTVTVRDAEGKPATGECVVAIYDRAVEYISGGSNVGDIKAHFWSWKRNYYPRYSSSLNRHGYSATKPADVQWEPLGMFGAQEADWNADGVAVNGMLTKSRRMARVQMEAVPTAAGLVAAPMQESAKLEQAVDAYAPAPMSGAGAMVEPAVRGEFADTALWLASLVTDDKGVATFDLTMPENLTGWRTRVWALASETRVGDGDLGVETRKNVIVRPQAPRFLTQKDQVILSANLHNYLPRAKTARVELVLEGGLLEPADGVALTREIELAALAGEARVDWLVHARRPGEAVVTMKIMTDEESDAARITVPVVVHGARRVDGFGGVIRGHENQAFIRFRVAEDRLPDQSRLELSFSPGVASMLLEALPFLIEYPYGCTEQTLNRFLPVVMTRRYLDRLGLKLSDAAAVADRQRTDPKSAEWAARFGVPSRHAKSPVFDDRELEAMLKQGLERLSSMQNADGGWGWFSGPGEQSWPHTTAVVVHGLLAAKENGAAISPAVLDEGVNWLRARQDGQVEALKTHVETKGEKGKARADNLDAFIAMTLAKRGHFNPDMLGFLYRDRLDLSLSGLAMLGLALHEEKAANVLQTVLENLEQFVESDEINGTAWLRVPSSGWWWWYNDEVETQAWYLKLLSRVDPTGDRAAGLAKYLLRNRKNGGYWRSTRDTAYAIEALAEYAAASGEVEPDMTVVVFLDGKQVMERRLRAENILDDNRFVLEGLAVEAGDHELRIVRTGSGNVYYGGALDQFSLEDPIARAGGELALDRAYYKLVREDGETDRRSAAGGAVASKTERYRRERIAGPFDQGYPTGVKLEPGDLIEVELTIETKNDYEYLVFEDMKAAGIEAVELRSGYAPNSLGAYVEYRDRKVVLFVRRLPRGTYSLAYRFRAETPGSFSALPAFGGGMYATDLFANSDEMKLRITEKGVYEEVE